MRRKIKFSMALIGVILSSFTVVPAFSDEAWNARMRSLATSMSNLLPFLVSEDSFHDPKTMESVKTHVENLYTNSRDLEMTLDSHGVKTSLAGDPLFKLMASGFARDIEDARDLLPSKNKAYAQQLLRGALTYCTTCHTSSRATTKASFPVFSTALTGLSLLEKMKLYAATRNFKKAVSEFSDALHSNDLEKLPPLALEKTARFALSLQIRTEIDEASVTSIIKDLSKLKNASVTFKNELQSWKESVSDLERVSTVSSSKLSDFENAKSLIDLAELKRHTSTHSDELRYLRASALLHSYLETKPSRENIGESYYLLGKCYDRVQQMGYWSLSETYYEACVREVPHTTIATLCFSRFDDLVTTGYSGSSGLHIPKNVLNQLTELRVLSEIKRNKLESK